MRLAPCSGFDAAQFIAGESPYLLPSSDDAAEDALSASVTFMCGPVDASVVLPNLCPFA